MKKNNNRYLDQFDIGIFASNFMDPTSSLSFKLVEDALTCEESLHISRGRKTERLPIHGIYSSVREKKWEFLVKHMYGPPVPHSDERMYLAAALVKIRNEMRMDNQIRKVPTRIQYYQRDFSYPLQKAMQKDLHRRYQFIEAYRFEGLVWLSLSKTEIRWPEHYKSIPIVANPGVGLRGHLEQHFLGKDLIAWAQSLVLDNHLMTLVRDKSAEQLVFHVAEACRSLLDFRTLFRIAPVPEMRYEPL